MFRAVMNMIQNAVEHTKENGIIYIDAKEQDGRLTFIVEDSGSGFTKEALLHGTEQFFMDDTSRNGEAHYGMGLFFFKKLWLKNMVEVLNFQILKIQVGRG